MILPPGEISVIEVLGTHNGGPGDGVPFYRLFKGRCFLVPLQGLVMGPGAVHRIAEDKDAFDTGQGLPDPFRAIGDIHVFRRGLKDDRPSEPQQDFQVGPGDSQREK